MALCKNGVLDYSWFPFTFYFLLSMMDFFCTNGSTDLNLLWSYMLFCQPSLTEYIHYTTIFNPSGILSNSGYFFLHVDHPTAHTFDNAFSYCPPVEALQDLEAECVDALRIHIGIVPADGEAGLVGGRILLEVQHRPRSCGAMKNKLIPWVSKTGPCVIFRQIC